MAPNALYSHVPGKTELVDALLDDRLSLVEAPDPDAADPVAALAALMTSSYEVLLARADLLPLYLARQGSRGPNAVRLGIATDALLARLDLAAEAIPSARRALIVHAIGCAAFAGGDGPVPAEMARADFTRSLRWLLDGIAAQPAESSDVRVATVSAILTGRVGRARSSAEDAAVSESPR